VAAGLSLAQLGGVELTRQAVHLIETGKVRPSMHSLRVLANRLAVPVASLLAPTTSRVPFDQDSVAEVARLCRDQQFQEVLVRAGEILELSRAPELVASAHYYMGEALCRMDRPMEALEHLRPARELFEALEDDQDRIAETMELEAHALHIAEDPRALDVARDALARYRAGAQGRPEVESRLLQRLGTILTARHEYGRARAHYDEALQVAGGVRDLGRLARLYHGLAICHHGEGDVRVAAELLTKAHTLYEAEDRLAGGSFGSDLARVENDLGLQLLRQGDLARADELLMSSLRRLQERGLERRLSRVLLTLGELRQRQGRLEEAVVLTEQARELAERLEETHALAVSYRQLGEVLAAARRRDEAAASFERALAILQAAGLRQPYAECRQVRDRVLGRGSQEKGSIA
jgi:tetratricopeptide (TPR) repeat protein/DNA-binding XRE family transcriptional regulator